jgi:hypothetical protein
MKLSAAFGRNAAISKICGKIVITPIAVIRHCRKSAERRIIQNRFVDMENTCATKSCEQRILSSAPPHRQARVACDSALIQ